MVGKGESSACIAIAIFQQGTKTADCDFFPRISQ